MDIIPLTAAFFDDFCNFRGLDGHLGWEGVVLLVDFKVRLFRQLNLLNGL